MISRHVFHRGAKGTRFLTDRLQGALSYDRIAGYFDSSLLEFAGEALESVAGRIRIVCNSDVSERDIVAARGPEQAQKLSFFKTDPGGFGGPGQERLRLLHRLLTNRAAPSLEVRVLPNDVFGLIHGKAGVITLADGSRTSFLGSANETFAGWNLNYELVWEDDSEEACAWVLEEFERLWGHSRAVPLAEAVIREVERLTRRKELDLGAWAKNPVPAGVLVEAPVYRKEFGLWPHQRSFVDLFWKTHRSIGARYILADQVGLGKTVQLGMAAQLMALTGSRPVLVLLPKTLMIQWQTELWDLMEIPTARWTGRVWVDETDREYSPNGKNPLAGCPRKIGIVSQGLITQGGANIESLLLQEWEGVIVDEAHRARRKKLPRIDDRGPAIKNPDTEANRLYAFLFRLASRARSVLFATATPVQMHPIEAWDLLRILAVENDHVLGSSGGFWRRPENALPYLLGEKDPPEDEQELWDYLRNPFPPQWEGMSFQYFRQRLGMDDQDAVVAGEGRIFSALAPDLQTQMRQSAGNLFSNHHPFLRHIIRRTRKYLEETVDPKTKEPYLRRIAVDLIDDEPLLLGSYLAQGYRAAESFCKALSSRVRGAGFFKTLLLRRIGSSINAGLSTVEKMLSTWDLDSEEDDEDDGDRDISLTAEGNIKNLTPGEVRLLEECRDALKIGLEQREGADPKRDVILQYLTAKGWAEDGCILFSQYFDTARWIGEEIARAFPDRIIGLYAGGAKSGIWDGGRFLMRDREEIKTLVRRGELTILVGTDAASEGLNLQALSTLINIDLPWNPTRLEQRKGRIQRIGQKKDLIKVLNLRYKDSVEDKVHQALSDRLQQIHNLFGQIPDVLKNVWVQVALDDMAAAESLIHDIPNINPFDNRYSRMDSTPGWETWNEVINRREKLEALRKGWGECEQSG